MSRGPALFTQADLARALKAAREAGGSWRVRVSRFGELLVEPVESPAALPAIDAAPQTAPETPPVARGLPIVP